MHSKFGSFRVEKYLASLFLNIVMQISLKYYHSNILCANYKTTLRHKPQASCRGLPVSRKPSEYTRQQEADAECSGDNFPIPVVHGYVYFVSKLFPSGEL